MKAIPTAIPEVLIIEPNVLADERGFFYESFNRRKFQEVTGLDLEFVQDNHSRSVRGVLRGMHYQLAPMAQGKLVRVVQGAVFDVAVDIRPQSATYGRWVGVELDAASKRQLWVPPGFAHGFLTLSDTAEFLYKTTAYYSPEHDRTLAWDSPQLGIVWPLHTPPILSSRDRAAPAFIPLD